MTVDPTPGYGAGYMDSQDRYDNSSTDSSVNQPMDDSETETDGMPVDESTQDSLEETAEDTTDDTIGGTRNPKAIYLWTTDYRAMLRPQVRAMAWEQRGMKKLQHILILLPQQEKSMV